MIVIHTLGKKLRGWFHIRYILWYQVLRWESFEKESWEDFNVQWPILEDKSECTIGDFAGSKKWICDFEKSTYVTTF